MTTKIKLVKGVGVNDFPGQVQRLRRDGGKVVREWTDPFYRCWVNMLTRQTPGWQIKHPSYRGVQVDERWYSFCNFREWLSATLKGQPLENYELDKDIIYHGCLKYSPETCALVPVHINRMVGRSILTACTGARYKSGKFYSQIVSEGRKKHLGIFDTKEQAHAAWQTEKSKELCRVLESYREDPLVNLGVVSKLQCAIDTLAQDLYLGKITTQLFK